LSSQGGGAHVTVTFTEALALAVAPESDVSSSATLSTFLEPQCELVNGPIVRV
jgi:hypothetical protein